MSEDTPIASPSEITNIVLYLNGDHGEISEPMNPADEWQAVDAIGFKVNLPLVEAPEQIESGELSRGSMYTLDPREKASKNHKSYRVQQVLAEKITCWHAPTR